MSVTRLDQDRLGMLVVAGCPHARRAAMHHELARMAPRGSRRRRHHRRAALRAAKRALGEATR